MKEWQQEKLHELRFIDNDRTMFQKTAEWARELGFEFCTFTMRVPVPVSNPKTFAATNYPEAWQAAYTRNNYVNIDPVVRHEQCDCEAGRAQQNRSGSPSGFAGAFAITKNRSVPSELAPGARLTGSTCASLYGLIYFGNQTFDLLICL